MKSVPQRSSVGCYWRKLSLSMVIELRLATLDDTPALQILIEKSVRVLSATYYSDTQITSALRYIFGVDSQLIKDGTYFVAVADDTIVGAGGWSKRATLFGGDQLKAATTDPLLEPEHDPARVRAFYVHPDWSRQGISRTILSACEAAASAHGFKRVELVATLPGEPLYLAFGYERIEPVEMKMPDGESIGGFRMGKDL